MLPRKALPKDEDDDEKQKMNVVTVRKCLSLTYLSVSAGMSICVGETIVALVIT